MAAESIPVAPLSIWQPVHLGSDELGRRVEVTLAERNMLIGGEPGGGKSVALQLIVAHGALSPDCRLILIDGKRVELGLWRECAERFIGPSIDDAIDTLHWLQDQIDKRTSWLLDNKMRKITPQLGWPVYLVPIDEVAYYSATVGTPTQQKEFNACNRDIVARGRAPGIIPSRPPSGPPPTSSPPRCGTCSATGGPSAAAPKHPRTRSSGTAGPTKATQPPRSTRKPAASGGSGPKTASPAGSKPPTSPTRKSSTSPTGPPKPAPPTTQATRAATRAKWSSCSARTMPHERPLPRGLLPGLRQPPGHPLRRGRRRHRRVRLPVPGLRGHVARHDLRRHRCT
jgi:FtsK/SpoIIIE family